MSINTTCVERLKYQNFQHSFGYHFNLYFVISERMNYLLNHTFDVGIQIEI